MNRKRRFLKPVLRGEIKFCFAQTEPDAGSDPANMRTRAVRDGDEFIINGTKRFITAAGRADYVAAHGGNRSGKESARRHHLLCRGFEEPRRASLSDSGRR